MKKRQKVRTTGLADMVDPKKVPEGFVASGQRQNIIDFVTKFPAMYVDGIDAAYIAGLEDATRDIKNKPILQ